jgi:hypothetical protein
MQALFAATPGDKRQAAMSPVNQRRVLFQPREPEDDRVFAELGDKEWYVLSVAVNGQRMR